MSVRGGGGGTASRVEKEEHNYKRKRKLYYDISVFQVIVINSKTKVVSNTP